MFGRKKKKAQAQPSNVALPPTGTPPLNDATPQKTKKTPKKDKKKDSITSTENLSVTPKKKGFRFGKKSRAPTAPYNDTSSVANDSIGDSSSLYQSEDAKLNNTHGSNAGLNHTPQNGNFRSPSFGSLTSPSSSVTTGSYQEKQSYISHGYEERDLEFWDEGDVLQWLGDQGLDYFVELFEGCEIDGEYLLDVTDEDLIDLEVDDAVLRRRFIDAVKAAHNKQTPSNFPTLDQQLSALAQADEASRNDAVKKTNNISEASTVPASDVKDSPRQLSPPPKLVLRKPTSDNDSDSEFDFDSDDMDNPLDDIPDNSNTRRIPDDDNSSPRSPIAKSVAPRSRAKKIESPRSPDDKAGGSRSTTNRVETPGSSVNQPSATERSHVLDAPDSRGKRPNKLPTSGSTIETTEIPTSPRGITPTKRQSNNIHSPGSHSDQRVGSSRSRSESVVTKWSETDVVAWLQEAQLSHLKNHFIENKVTGMQLLNIDMQLLDVMGITSEGDRELLLAKLYELNNPAANVPEKDLISALNNTSGYEQRKYMAAMKVLQSSDSEEVQILPPETLAVPDSFSSSSRTPSTASDQGRAEERKKKGGLSKLKDVISPKRRSRDYNMVQVWTDIVSSGITTVSLRLTETEDVQDLIKLCLDQLGLIEDWRLYCILDAVGSLADRKDKGFEREMEDSECPVIVQQDWLDRTPRHFELRQRPAQGGSIKIVLRLNDEKPKGKLLAISLSTPAREVIPLGLLRFGLKEADPRKYCLLEVDRAGDLHDVDEDSIPLQSDSHAFVLCESAGKDSQLALCDDEDGTEEEQKIGRTGSLTSKASSKVSFSGISRESSAGSDLLASLRFDDEKLSKLEEEMATIEESLSQAKGDAKGSSNTSAQDTSISRLVTSPPAASQAADKDIIDKEAVIDALRRENKTLQEKAKQLSVVQKALSQLEQSYKRNETDSKQRVREKRETLTAESGESLPEAVGGVQSRLHQVGEEIGNKKLNILKIQQQQKQIQGRNMNSLDGSIQQAELEYRVALEESSMLTLQQQQAQLLSKLELALTDHQVAMEKKTASERSQPLFPSLQADQHYSLHVVHRSRGKRGYDLTLAPFQNGRGAIIQSCSQDKGMEVGDRLLELNGETIANTPISEVNQILSSVSRVRLVLLRETDEAHMSGDQEETMRLEEHLEAMQGDNDRLKDETKRLKGFESQARQATQLQIAVQQLQKQLSDSESRAEGLERQLVDEDSGQIMRQMQDDKHKLQMEMISLKESVCRLEDTLDEKTNELSVVCQERDSVIEELMNKADDNATSSHHLISEALEEGLPLWEALKSASKTEILEVLRDELEEAGRQKEYLDQLYTLMLERAPSLLEDLEEDFDASELSSNEEFC